LEIFDTGHVATTNDGVRSQVVEETNEQLGNQDQVAVTIRIKDKTTRLQKRCLLHTLHAKEFAPQVFDSCWTGTKYDDHTVISLELKDQDQIDAILEQSGCYRNDILMLNKIEIL
jgi:hypothetical protein